MATYRWTKFPTNWIRFSGGLCLLDSKPPGIDAAALKLLIAISGKTSLPESRSIFGPGRAQLTYDEFERETTLSRAMIARGIAILNSVGRIAVTENGKGNIYSICDYEEQKGWGKLPFEYLLRGNGNDDGRLATIPNRGRGGRDALKIYFALIAFRDNASGYSRLSYNKISEYTGVPRRYIRGALSILYEAGMVHRERFADLPDTYTSANQYWVAGVSQRRAPAVAAVIDVSAEFEDISSQQ